MNEGIICHLSNEGDGTNDANCPKCGQPYRFLNREEHYLTKDCELNIFIAENEGKGWVPLVSCHIGGPGTYCPNILALKASETASTLEALDLPYSKFVHNNDKYAISSYVVFVPEWLKNMILLHSNSQYADLSLEDYLRKSCQ